MTKIGIIGGGYWGEKIRDKIAVLSEEHDLRLMFVAGRNDDFLAMSGQHEIDWAVVTTPTESHRSIAADLLEARRNVFCTKPLTSSTADSEYLVTMARELGVCLYIDDVFSYHPGFSRMRELAGSNSIHILWNKWNGREFGSVRDVLFRLCYHDLYLIEDLVSGEQPVVREFAVSADLFRLKIDYGQREVIIEYSIDSAIPQGHRINTIDFTHKPGEKDALQQMLLTAFTTQFDQQRNNGRGLWVNRQVDQLLGQML